MSVNPDELTERQEQWNPIEGIETPAGRALLHDDHDGLTVTLLFSEIAGASDANLRIEFGDVLAYCVYEEFEHPWETAESAPRLSGRWDRYIYPLLQINDSKWIASLPNLLFVHPGATHYRLLTLDQIIDVLCLKQPKVSWVTA